MSSENTAAPKAPETAPSGSVQPTPDSETPHQNPSKLQQKLAALKQIVPNIKSSIQSWKKGLAQTPSLYLATVFVPMILALGITLSTGLWMLKHFHQATASMASSHAPHSTDTASHGEEHDKHESSAVVIGASPFQKATTELEDGNREEDHDLSDPEVSASRGLAAIAESDVTADLGERFVDLPDVMTTTGATTGQAHVFIRLSFLVKNKATKDELTTKQTQISALVSSVVGEFDRSDFICDQCDGRDRLKIALQKEINHVLTQGRVEDVLFQEFTVK